VFFDGLIKFMELNCIMREDHLPRRHLMLGEKILKCKGCKDEIRCSRCGKKLCEPAVAYDKWHYDCTKEGYYSYPKGPICSVCYDEGMKKPNRE
jgi:hypothetical protein